MKTKQKSKVQYGKAVLNVPPDLKLVEHNKPKTLTLSNFPPSTFNDPDVIVLNGVRYVREKL